MSGGYVYLMRAGEHHKIGITRDDPDDRRRALQTGSAHRIEVVHEVFVNRPDLLEDALHDEWRQHRTTGEWFALPEQAVRDTVRLMDEARSMGL